MSFFTFPPPFQADFVDEEQLVSPAWRAWLENIFNTTGSTGGSVTLNNTGIGSIFTTGNIALEGDPVLKLNGVTWPNSQTLTESHVFQHDGTGKLNLKTPASLNNNYSTGDIIMSFRTSKTNWIRLNSDIVQDTGAITIENSIGNTLSSAVTRAHVDTKALFLFLWTNYSANDICPVSGGRGTTALGDWNANKKIQLPHSYQCLIADAGAGSGLSSRTVGIRPLDGFGQEFGLNATIDYRHIPAHTHTVDLYTAGATAGTNHPIDNAAIPSGGTRGAGFHESGITTYTHPNDMPTTYVNWFIRL